MNVPRICKQCNGLLSGHTLSELRDCARELERERREVLQRLMDQSERNVLESQLVWRIP